MYTKSNSCSICLENKPELININEADPNNVKWSCKLRFCVPEVAWTEGCCVCQACTTQLDTFCSFRNRCLWLVGVYTQLIEETTDKPLKSADCSCILCIPTPPTYNCYHCSEKFTTKSILASHITSHSAELEEKACPISDAPEDLKGDESSGYYEDNDGSLDDLQPKFQLNESKPPKKRQKQARKTAFVCDECKNVFISSKKLINHAIRMHGFNPSTIKPFECDKCESKFSTSSNLLQHKKYHMGKRSHICTFCGKGYITKSDLNTHEKQHLNKREYQCTGCPKTFNTNKDLRSHRLVVHTDPSLWNYVCTFCQKRFPIKSNLDQHMRRHTGDKRFGCHICEKRFVDKIVLQKHIKSHSNFRAFKCEHCTKEYKDNRVLEMHLTKVHGIGNAKIPIRVKKYFCHVCPKSYFAKNKLTRHMFSHTGEKPFVCHICERKFTDKSYVKQHLKTTHNVFQVEENK